MQYNGNVAKDEEEQQKKVTEAALNSGDVNKPKVVPQNPAGDGFVTGGNKGSVLGGGKDTMISNPAANWEDTVLDDGLKKGDPNAQVGVRKTLENEFGVDSHRIGYDGTDVTLDGTRIVSPADNRDGTTYVHSREDIVKGLSAHARSNGQVAVRDYVNSRGVPMDVEWNQADGTVSINGTPVKPTYVIDGKAYVPQSQLDELLGASEKQMGVRSDSDILKDAKSKWGGMRDDAAADFMGSDFSWNPKEDAAYQEFMDLYRRGVEDEYAANMAQAKFRTGGAASPAAMQMAANIRARALDDAARYGQQYEDRAYGRWQDENNLNLERAGFADEMMRSDYGMESASNQVVADSIRKNRDDDWTQKMMDLEYAGAKDDLTTKLLDGGLYRKYASDIYADEAAVSGANADTAVRQNQIGEQFDLPMMQEAYSQAVAGTRGQELANLLAEKNLSWVDLLNMGDFGVAIYNAMVNEAKTGVPSGIDWNALRERAGL